MSNPRTDNHADEWITINSWRDGPRYRVHRRVWRSMFGDREPGFLCKEDSQRLRSHPDCVPIVPGDGWR